MASYKHILIASDLSKNSVVLCKKASSLARALDAKLSIIHIVEHLPLMYAGGEFALPLEPQLEEELADEAKQNLHQQVAHHKIPQKNQFVLVGDKQDEMLQFVTKHEVDLVVVGNHPPRGLDHLLGTTTTSLLHNLPCDVLAIQVEES